MAERCDFRDFHECSCPAGSCQQTPAPLRTPSKRFTAELIAFWVVMALIAAGTGYALQQQEREIQIQARV